MKEKDNGDRYRSLVTRLKKVKKLVVFTGAGISKESGIPTFRGKGGIWEKYNPEDLATPRAFERDPVKVWKWYIERYNALKNVKPNNAHRIIAELEEIFDVTVITQNVDGLHRRAGSTKIIELHGRLDMARCDRCGNKLPMEKVVTMNIPPKCPHCGSLLRPDVVLFGEPLDEMDLLCAYEITGKAEVFFTVGTSGYVYPANQLPIVAKERGILTVEVNPEETPLTGIHQMSFREGAVSFFTKLEKLLKEEGIWQKQR